MGFRYFIMYLRKESKIFKKNPSPDNSVNPFEPEFTSSVRYVRVAQKIAANSRKKLLKKAK